MTIGRRAFLTSGAAMLAAPRIQAADPVPEILRAGVSTAQLAPGSYDQTEVWSYNGSVPGPEIRVAQGGRVSRRLINDLPQPTSIHWHGIRIDNAMDGVPGVTQDAVEPGASFDYDFKVPDAGSYWYHTHNRSWEQMARGLAGPLIVTERDSPDVDAEVTLILQDWRLDRSAAMVEDFGAMHDMSHAGRLGNVVSVNGRFEARHPVLAGERLRLRLFNMATARIFDLGVSGLAGWVVALDGMPLETPRPLEQLTLAPAQRADLIVDLTAAAGKEAFLVQMERDGGYAIASFNVEGTLREPRGTVPDPLPGNPLTPVDLAASRVLDLRMEGGAMRGLSEAQHDGRQLSMRELMQAGQVWALNGVAGMPETPLFEAALGETIRLPLINDTAFGHAMHTHGHHFREVTEAGLGPWRDTILVAPGQTREIAFAADNPGDWLLHCHMLGHQASGMKTWFRVG